MLKPIQNPIDQATMNKLEEFAGRPLNQLSDKELCAFYHAELCRIANIVIDDDECDTLNEMTGEVEYVWLSHVDARQSLTKAVELARDAIRGSHRYVRCVHASEGFLRVGGK